MRSSWFSSNILNNRSDPIPTPENLPPNRPGRLKNLKKSSLVIYPRSLCVSASAYSLIGPLRFGPWTSASVSSVRPRPLNVIVLHTVRTVNDVWLHILGNTCTHYVAFHEGFKPPAFKSCDNGTMILSRLSFENLFINHLSSDSLPFFDPLSSSTIIFTSF